MTDLDKLNEWFKGDQDAVDLNRAIHQVVEVWDDLIDKDRIPTPKEINDVFYLTLVAIPRNAFYRQHFVMLSPLIETAILDWHTANAFEKAKTNLETAYSLRCTMQSLTVMCARIIGGFEWGLQVNTKLRSDTGETCAEYISKFGDK